MVLRWFEDAGKLSTCGNSSFFKLNERKFFRALAAAVLLCVTAAVFARLPLDTLDKISARFSFG